MILLFHNTTFPQINIYDEFGKKDLPGWTWNGVEAKFSFSQDNDSGYAIIYTNHSVKPNTFVGTFQKQLPFVFSDSCLINIMVKGVSNDLNFIFSILYDVDRNGIYNEDQDILVSSKPATLMFNGWKNVILKLSPEEFEIISNFDDNFSVTQSESFGVRFDFKTGGEYNESPFETGIALITEVMNLGIEYDPVKKDKKDTVSYFQASNYPNPFSSATTISYTLQESTYLKITVYDRLGRDIETLVDGEHSPGTYSVEFDGSALETGTYFYRIYTNSKTEVWKMVIER
ncbi:MAG: T9SS type A sorting domain-containing protein [Ignavibacteria bacterium]|nr:T9SS type A sorting domain-containing protein [Ignavibacteria bacterium]